jgi:hypothetical protein
MRRIGFSTGALAKGDFRKGIQLQELHAEANAIELSALRESELDSLISAMPTLDLRKYEYVSVHAPSSRVNFSETELVDRLKKLTVYTSALIVHPDIIKDPNNWKPIENAIVLENMDQRKPIARNAAEMKKFFEVLPKARFCFDIGHARQVDPTLSIAVELLLVFAERLAEVHISEVDAASKHVQISSIAMRSFQKIASLIPQETPVIIESTVPPSSISDEIRMALESLSERKVTAPPEVVHSACR